jgi:Relaxase/Mobilisation nuclease domain/Large polyvalent protein-associated domain 7
MISKVIPRKKKDGTSAHIKDLVLYLLKGDKKEKVSAVVYNGFVSEKTTIDEMNALAGLGQGDSLYHFVISWPEGEHPTDDQGIEAAQMMIQALVEDHNKRAQRYPSRKTIDSFFLQSIITVHRDTQFSHVHVLLNRRDPESRTLLNLYWDYLTRDKTCRQIELKQRWRHTPGYYEIDPRDGHSLIRSHKTSRENSVLSECSHRIEEYTGGKSFVRCVQEQVIPLLKEAQSWSEAHERLAELGLQFKEARKGLVMTDGDVYAKASSCGKDCSRTALERRWGVYQPKEMDQRLLRRSEQKAGRALLRNKLWDEYQAYKKEFYTKWLVERGNTRQLQRQSEKNRQQKLLFDKREQRRMILAHSWQGKGVALQALMSVHALDCARKKSILYEQIRQERAEIKQRSKYLVKPFRSWRDFCETRAAEGDIAAQRALRGFRYRDRRKKVSDCQILPEDKDLFVSGVSDKFSDIWDFMLFIHEDGRVDYFDRKTQILSFSDHGNSLHIFQEEDEQVLEATLWLAIEKWDRVQLKGDEAFQRKVWDVALRLRAEKRVIVDSLLAASLPQTLSDPALVKHHPVPAPAAISNVAKEPEPPKPRRTVYPDSSYSLRSR